MPKTTANAAPANQSLRKNAWFISSPELRALITAYYSVSRPSFPDLGAAYEVRHFQENRLRLPELRLGIPQMGRTVRRVRRLEHTGRNPRRACAQHAGGRAGAH